jgi:hypothetical protein
MEYSQPVVTPITTTRELSLKPVIVKDVVLISPGVWTGMDNKPTSYSLNSIRNGFENTNWENMNLFLDHQDTKARGVGNWAGYVKNPRFEQNELRGDLEIWHPLISMFIKEAKAKFGVSMTTEGIERMLSENNFEYNINKFISFSIVDDPACRISWLPRELASADNAEKITTCGSFEISKKELELNAQKETAVENITDSANIVTTTKECSEEHIKMGVKMGEEIKKESIAETIKENNAVISPVVESTSVIKEEVKPIEVSPNSEIVELRSKIDALSSSVEKALSGITSLTALVQKNLSTPKAEVSEDETDEDELIPEVLPEAEADEERELSDARKELDLARKELVAAKEESNKPDRKTLAASGESSEVMSRESANAAMIRFFQEKMI